MSHLLQMRGLKRLLYSYLHLSVLVASFTDAWIETYEEYEDREQQFSRIFYRCVD